MSLTLDLSRESEGENNWVAANNWILAARSEGEKHLTTSVLTGRVWASKPLPGVLASPFLPHII